ncbi:hypothetical protein EC968_008093 [Mortierella alpina]|nr:hypothetical protein EC968_008093 [Mortierella alpina]
MNAPALIVPNIQQDLLNIINEGRTLQQVATITQADASLTIFGTGALAKALRAMGTNPLAFRPTSYPGVLTEQLRRNEIAGERARYYIRVLTVSLLDLESYAERYPADAEWVNTLKMSTSQTSVSLLYVGMTTESSPLGRHRADVASPPKSRLGNVITHFQGSRGGNWRIYEWTGLSRPIARPDDVRTTPLYGDIERNLIALLRGRGVNAASGGFTYNWEPTRLFMARVQGALITYRATNPSVAQPNPAPQGMFNAAVRNTVQATNAVFAAREQHSQNTRRTLVSPTALEEVKVDAESNILMYGGRVISALITKDIPEEALQGGYAYNSPTAGFAPRMERHIRALISPMARSLAGTLSLPRLDLWACTITHRHTEVALKCVCRYLINLRPLLVVSHSSNVAHLLQLDLLSSVWPSPQSCDAFVGASNPRVIAPVDSSQLADLEHPNFLEVLGEVCIIKFGPGDADYALHIPERDPGNMRYNPTLAPLYCELHLLCKAVYAIAVSEMLKGGPPPEATANPLPWFKTIRANILRALTESGLSALMSDKKTEIRALESRVLSQRMLSAAQRGSESGATVSRASPAVASYLLQGQVAAGDGYDVLELPTRNAYLTPQSLQDLLATHPPNRAQLLEGRNITTAAPKPPAVGNLRLLQWAVTMDTHYERVDRGIKVAYRPPCPSVLEFGSAEHRNWFLTRARNVTYHQSARSYGKNPTEALTTAEDWAHYNESRRCVGRTMSERSTNSFESSIKKMWNLAGVSYSKRYSEQFQIECQLCGEVELKTSQNVHICKGLANKKDKKGTTIANAQDTIWKRHLLYPHDVFDF